MNQILNIVEDIFKWFFEVIFKPFEDLHPLRDLIFGRNGTEEYLWLTFKDTEIINVYSPVIDVMTSLAAIFVVAGIVISGMRISKSGLNPSNRTTVIEFLKDIFIVGIAIANIGSFYQFLFFINMSLVEIFSSAEDTIYSLKLDVTGESALGFLIVELVLLGLAIWANFYYMMRKLTLLILMGLGPLMVAFWLVPQFKPITLGWMKELTGTIFVQSIHAFTFWIVATISVDQNSIIPSVILYVIFIPVSESIRSLFGLGGDMNSNLSKAGAAFGLAGLAGMYGVARGALGDKSLMGALREGYQGIKSRGGKDKDSTDVRGVGANAGTDIGTTKRAESMLKAGQIMSKAGKATFGMAGVIAGSGLGPGGAMVGGTMGMIGGGAVGGIAGRTGSAAVMGIGNQLKKGIEGAKKGAKLGEIDPKEHLAEQMAKEETNSWMSQNKEGLERDLKKRFPEASDKQLKELFNSDVSKKHQQHKQKALDTLRGVQNEDGQYANASELANHSAEQLTQDWAKNNKQSELNKISQNHPNLSENEKIAKWNKTLGNKKQDFLKLANSTAADMGNGKDIRNSSLNRDEFADKLSTNLKGNELANQSAEQLTKDWAKNNKQKELSKMSQEHPNMPEHEKVAKWNKTLSNKKQEFLQVANGTASEMGKGIIGTNGSLNKDEFANKLSDNLLSKEKARYKVENPGLSDSEIDVKFNKDNGTKKQAYISSISNATNGISNQSYVPSIAKATKDLAGQSLIKKGHVNSDHLANVMATNMTSSDKKGFIGQLMKDEGYTESEATKEWESVGKQRAYTSNLSQVKGNLSNYAPGQVILPKSTGSQLFKGAAVGVGAAGGFVAGVSGISQISEFLSDTKIGKAVVQGTTGLGVGLETAKGNMKQELTNASTPVQQIKAYGKGGISAVLGGTSSGVGAFKNSIQEEHIPQNVVGKQNNFKNAVAFGSGVIGGVDGYQKGAALGINHNPYNGKVEQKAMEVSEISQMASEGTVQLVTNGNQSYIQARDKTGKTQIVSRFGSGDSSLGKGEVVYQDLNVQDGAIVPRMIDGTNSSAYMVDSGGGKIPLSRSINVNPNSLVSNRNIPTQVPKDVQPFNFQVDSGQYYLDDVINNGQQVRMVTERNRSYMVAKGKNGIEHRVSPYGEGDTRLSTEEVIYTDCQVANQRLKVQKIYSVNQETNVEEQKVDFTNRINPNELIPKKPNPRLNKRKDNELLRHPQGV